MRTIISIILCIVSLTLLAQESFDKYFTDKVLRFDFMLAGNSQKTSVYPVALNLKKNSIMLLDYLKVEAILQKEYTALLAPIWAVGG
jgi:hypothetical protein